jgi:ketosteroid isomerase-like protein
MGANGDGGADLVDVSDRWWTAIWRDGDLDAVDELFTDPFTRHSSAGSETMPRAAYRARLAEVQRVLSNATTTVDDRAVVGDRVWTRATTRGLNLETGERAILTWMLVQRFEGGRIAEQWAATVPGVEW